MQTVVKKNKLKKPSHINIRQRNFRANNIIRNKRSFHNAKGVSSSGGHTLKHLYIYYRVLKYTKQKWIELQADTDKSTSPVRF